MLGSRELGIFVSPEGKRFKTIQETACGECRELRAVLRFTGIWMQLILTFKRVQWYSPSCFNSGGSPAQVPGTSPKNCNIFARNKEALFITFQPLVLRVHKFPRQRPSIFAIPLIDLNPLIYLDFKVHK